MAAGRGLAARLRRGAVPRLGTRRFFEVDALRGVAVVMMVIYHVVFDLYFFQITDAVFTTRFWPIFGKATAVAFISLAGVSLAISYNRSPATWGRFARRGLRIWAWGVLLSVLTWVALGPLLFIKFGVLHLIGLSVALSYPLLRHRRLNLVLALAILALARPLSPIAAEYAWTSWLGFHIEGYYPVDHFALVPWYGVFLLGLFAGNTIYRGYRRAFELPDLSRLGAVRLLAAMGQHSLPIYLLHQPLLLAVFFLFGMGEMRA